LLFFDPGSEILVPGWVKNRLRDTYSGSATLTRDIPFDSYGTESTYYVKTCKISENFIANPGWSL
jgi:hypothetical protein